MLAELAPGDLSASARRVLVPDAPAPLRLMAARGALPGVKPGEILVLLAALSVDDDPKVAETAEATFVELPEAILDGALSGDLPAFVLDKLARARINQHQILERVLRMPRIAPATLEHLAELADERAGELIATNEELMLKNPVAIEKLYMNRRVRMSTADRLIELAVRHDLELGIPAYREAAQAIRNELIPEPSEKPSYDDLLFANAEQAATRTGTLAQNEDTHEIDDEGEEKVRAKFLPLHAMIAQLTITQKIRRCMLGNAAERLLLVRDPNRLVAQAAAKSPNMRDAEAAQISASRAVSEDVLRIIAQNREFTRNYQVKLNLVSNPRTPLTFSARLLPLLRDNDVKALAKSKNVSGAIAQAANQQIQRKQGKTR